MAQVLLKCLVKVCAESGGESPFSGSQRDQSGNPIQEFMVVNDSTAVVVDTSVFINFPCINRIQQSDPLRDPD